MAFLRWLESWFGLFPRVPQELISAIAEIIIIAYLVYILLLWIKNTRAWLLLRGLVLIFVFTIICTIFRFDAILWILGKIATIAVTALIIVFQPELRRALEQLGSKNILFNLVSIKNTNEEEVDNKYLQIIVKASFELAKSKTGALIVIKRKESLSEYENTGIKLDAKVSSQLLVNIFEHNTPLHDGAAIVENGRITAATCYLPLSSDEDIPKAYGTRHRAAIGMSEKSDAVTVVVSEETGRVSVAFEGKLKRVDSREDLFGLLVGYMVDKNVVAINPVKKFRLWKGKNANETKAD